MLATYSSGVDEERCRAGAGFAIDSGIVGKLSGLPKSGLLLFCNKHCTIISVYAPTMTNPGVVKDEFYNDLDNITSAASRFSCTPDRVFCIFTRFNKAYLLSL